MYSVAGYGRMVSDRVRMGAYEAALRAVVAPGSVVVDLGTGTGVVACLAARMGAQVHAIEPSDVVQVAREVAAANGLAARITFHQAWSREVELPGHADVIVCDLRGVLPLLGRNLEDLADARARFLRPGGVLIPLRDRVHAAPVEAPDDWRRCVPPSDEDGFGLDLEPARRYAAGAWYQAHFAAGELLAEPRQVAVVDYLAPAVPELAGRMQWTAERDAVGHGMAVWFDAELAPGIGFGNGPGSAATLYGQAFFPWPRPVALVHGDRVEAELRAVRVGDDWVWAWDTAIAGGDGAPRERFRQSTLRNALPSLARLRRGLHGHVPLPSREGELLREVLTRMDGHRTVAQIAAEIAEHLPGADSEADPALQRVARLSREWSR